MKKWICFVGLEWTFLIRVVYAIYLQVKALQEWKSQFSGAKSTECLYKEITYKNSDNWRDGDCRSCYCQVGLLLLFCQVWKILVTLYTSLSIERISKVYIRIISKNVVSNLKSLGWRLCYANFERKNRCWPEMVVESSNCKYNSKLDVFLLVHEK